jgi:hypothetical protein
VSDTLQGAENKRIEQSQFPDSREFYSNEPLNPSENKILATLCMCKGHHIFMTDVIY